MAQLTKEQKGIIDALKKEFLKINENATPVTSGLINVAQIKADIIEKEKFIAECKAENTAFERKKHHVVVADAERLRGDLNQLGLDVRYRNDGTCVSSFSIIKLGDTSKDSLFYISYDNSQYIERTKGDTKATVYTSFKPGCNLSGYSGSGNRTHFENIEALVSSKGFTDKLKRMYEEVKK